MKKMSLDRMYIKILSNILIFILSINLSVCQDNLGFSGNLFSEHRLRPNNSYQFSWNETRLDLQINKKLKSKYRLYSDAWFRNFGLPNYSSMSKLYNTDDLYPYNIQLREAYVEIYGFIFKNLDLKIGKQRIAWGKADKLNPTDNLNPYDLEDIWDFGRHNGSEALRAIYYINNYSVEGVIIPYFRPANLPMGDWSNSFISSFSLPLGLQSNNVVINVNQPKYNLKESTQAGLKINGILAGIDYSLSYLNGRDGLGLPSNAILQPVDTQFINNIPVSILVDIVSELKFPRYHIFGFDVSGTLGPLGIWGEMAAFLPRNEQVLKTDLSLLNPQLPVAVIVDSTVLKKESYFKYIVGADCRFLQSFYFNFQYLHGFIHERGRAELNDYFIGQFEKTFFNEQLKIIPLSGGFIVNDWKDIANNYSLIFAPEIQFKPNDNTTLNLIYRNIDGQGDGVFSSYKNNDEIVFKLTFYF